MAAAGLASVLLVFVGYAAWFGDEFGGTPHVRVPIDAMPATAAPAKDPPMAVPKTPTRDAPVAQDDRGAGRRSAGQVEALSGVAVTRPAGTAAPEALIVQVPDEGSGGLKRAPDPRLVEKSRFGLLPQVGPDGARSAQIYARPVGTLPGGVPPLGRVAIVVGGLGISDTQTASAITKLPPAVTLAFAPYGGEVATQAARARAAGHEIMLQMPMEPFDYPDSDPGPHTLLTGPRATENIDHLRWALGRLSGIIGITNYMGAKLTADPTALAPVLREANARGLVVLDDGSSARSRVVQTAADGHAVRADAVVDAVSRAVEIDRALAALEVSARAKGLAVGSGSALPLSIERIAAWSRGLEARGILLVPVSAAFAAAGRRASLERPALERPAFQSASPERSAP